jgi:predicted RNase H-like HicB family nuclease
MAPQHNILSYSVIFEPCPEGGYTVTVPALPGVVTEGDSLEDARAMAKEAIELHIESLKANGEPVPVEDEKSPIHFEKMIVEVGA